MESLARRFSIVPGNVRESISVRYRKTVGHKFRDYVGNFTKKTEFIRKHIFPNFIVVHYFYIITIAILASIFMYPIHNHKYIDILFLASGAATQGGLSTVNLNSLTLYQQIVLYIACNISTPIVIHTALAFVRLYWFERYFDDIKNIAMHGFQKRRAMTLLGRQRTQQSKELQGQESSSSTDTSNSSSSNSSNESNFQQNLFSGKALQRKQSTATTGTQQNQTSQNSSENSTDSSESDYPSIKFAGRRATNEMSLQDIYRSVLMLHEKRNSRKQNNPPEEQHASSSTLPPASSNASTSSLQDSNKNSPGSLSFSNKNESQGLPNNTKLTFDIVKPPTRKRVRKGNIGRKQFYYSTRHGSGTKINLSKGMRPSRRPQSENIAMLRHETSSIDPLCQSNSLPEVPNKKSSGSFKRWNTKIFSHFNTPTNTTSLTSDAESVPSEHPIDFEDNSFNFNILKNRPLSRTMTGNYLSWQPTYGRNSVFIGLNRQQREELGGVEYRSIKLLCLILVLYNVGSHITAFTMLLPWITTKSKYATIVKQAGATPAWWGFFTAMSCYTDLGLTLTPNSMQSFTNAVYPQLVLMWFITIGNTGFPVFLRFIIWVLFKVIDELSPISECLGFLLDHPRRCFTLLFPSAATWWLLVTLLGLNITDWILFIILDFGTEVLKPFSKGIRVLIGLFQAVSTRTAGFTVIDISQLHPSIQVSYMLMMYVSVLPLAISIRRTNVYEEQSLGVYEGFNELNTDDLKNYINNENSESKDDENDSPDTKKKVSAKSFIGAHLRRQLSFDLWFIFLGLFIICICENGKIQDVNKPAINVFSILFEVVSAYGTVGLSLGYPGTNTSLCGQFTTLSKLIIIMMLIRGRHRGLPYSLDRAIILPSDKLRRFDVAEDMKMKRRTVAPDTNDPATGYVKETIGKYKKGVKKLRKFFTVSNQE
ncbi:hypothetical protein KAFR_0G00730 [Kazachstania africana CBS 2517]|uniref:Potassium transport protein n=1 Tax=Kazachstania africana (strain ATCC 22294 / BCRC 22015 / CBS 2517 / CECT 1963 / NBRC 1671 / NRRL Y-8276) TaxID=1071382 RepID=H2AXK6_KAZAF|nr:hypothetical protein KAFR_0G00730 [Kazachstania africana CBS 2517]CCF59106.1 hypothetical protein KAFR_0G00730 [Kazachstania africana CBS 2517]